jgi:hypothetical protein
MCWKTMESGEERESRSVQPQDVPDLCEEIAEAYQGVDLDDIEMPVELLDRLFPEGNKSIS